MSGPEKSGLDKGGIMKYLLLIPVFIITYILSVILYGWVFSILWSWFIVPLFSLPVLSVPEAIGIAMIIKMITYQYQDPSIGNKSIIELIGNLIGIAIIAPFIILFTGWIVTLFI